MIDINDNINIKSSSSSITSDDGNGNNDNDNETVKVELDMCSGSCFQLGCTKTFHFTSWRSYDAAAVAVTSLESLIVVPWVMLP